MNTSHRMDNYICYLYLGEPQNYNILGRPTTEGLFNRLTGTFHIF